MRKLYKIVINKDDNSGMDAISLVANPAVEREFLKFDKEQPLKFDADKQIITGVVALADVPIYRFSPSMGEYWVVFDKETIQTMVEKYAKNGLFNSVNLQHDDNNFVDGCYLFESYIINKERGVCPVEFNDIPDGSWIASFKIENQELWNQIKTSGKLNGFSLQGMFSLEECFSSQRPNKIKFLKDNLMKLTKVALRNLFLGFEDVNTDKGIITVEGEIAEGSNVYVGDEPAADGDYVLDNGDVITVADGVITAVKKPEVEPENEPEVAVEGEDENPAEPANEPANEPDEKDAKIAELEAKVAELMAENEELRTKLGEKDAEIADKDEKLAMSVEKYVAQMSGNSNVKTNTFKTYLK